MGLSPPAVRHPPHEAGEDENVEKLLPQSGQFLGGFCNILRCPGDPLHVVDLLHVQPHRRNRECPEPPVPSVHGIEAPEERLENRQPRGKDVAPRHEEDGHRTDEEGKRDVVLPPDGVGKREPAGRGGTDQHRRTDPGQPGMGTAGTCGALQSPVGPRTEQALQDGSDDVTDPRTAHRIMLGDPARGDRKALPITISVWTSPKPVRFPARAVPPLAAGRQARSWFSSRRHSHSPPGRAPGPLHHLRRPPLPRSAAVSGST